MPLKALTTNMIVTGVLLLPTAVPHAIQDLQDLKTTIEAASVVLEAAPNNASWGFFNPGAPAGTSGTADLVSNITSTILRVKYLLDVDKVRSYVDFVSFVLTISAGLMGDHS
ncbi:hypothetical protein DM02DRAFT_674865 [Periconia macrospinosa]|uniref:Uncharacterized protein n=1 Tax=Periconia macrospinosa TaxID=97972 RepID=A0A2V1DE67_9PLEO|nr:hypothetical protein DM02DRAFT_674865 [Periconia macrospinosa]